jgi:methyl-accepting chemotaxis protein
VSRSIIDSVRVQTEATQKIAESVERAATQTPEVADTIAGVNNIADRRRLDAQRITEAVASLNRQAAMLQQEAQLFIAKVRAA